MSMTLSEQTKSKKIPVSKRPFSGVEDNRKAAREVSNKSAHGGVSGNTSADRTDLTVTESGNFDRDTQDDFVVHELMRISLDGRKVKE